MRVLISVLLLLAGFSQCSLAGIRPVDFLILIVSLSLISRGYLSKASWAGAIMVVTILSWAVGGGVNAKEMIISLLTFLFTFSLIGYVRKSDRLEVDEMLAKLNFGMFCSNLAALGMLLLFPSFKPLVADMSGGGLRFSGFFNQANGLALVLVSTFPLSIYFFVKRKSLWDFVNVVVFILCVILTQSRGAIYSIVLGFAIVYGIRVYRTGEVLRRVVTYSIVIAFAATIFRYAPDYISQNFGIELTRFNDDYANDRSLNQFSLGEFSSDRLYLVEASVRTILRYPFGIGFQPQHEKIGEVTGIYLVPHNYFLSLILTHGVLFGSALVALLLSILFSFVLFSLF